MHQKHDLANHWIPELYNRLNLPVYDGIQEALEASNKKRKELLCEKKLKRLKEGR